MLVVVVPNGSWDNPYLCQWLANDCADVSRVEVNSKWPTKLLLSGTRATVEICKFSRLDGRILRWKWILAKQIRMATVCCMQASIKTRVSGFIRFDLLRSRTININFCTLPFSKDVLPAAWKTVLGYTTVIPWRKKSAKVCSWSILICHNYRDGNLWRSEIWWLFPCSHDQHYLIALPLPPVLSDPSRNTGCTGSRDSQGH